MTLSRDPDERAAGHILLVDDDEHLCRLLAAALVQAGFRATTRASAVAALAELEIADYNIVVTDIDMPEMSGLEFCARLLERPSPPTVVVMTSHANAGNAIAALRLGVDDFLAKPVRPEAFVHRLEQLLFSRRATQEVVRLRRALDVSEGFGELLGESNAARRVYRFLTRVVDSEAPVLITGESGTGKELVARELHRLGPRGSSAFVPVNCSAIPESLLESEFFGHARGAFTGAREERAGLFVKAQAGTLFLDEIGEMPLHTQAKLLRALEAGRIRPVGGDREVEVDVRIMAASNRELEQEVEEGRFREDLFFRVNVIQVNLPPLRERGGDVALLAYRFAERFAAESGHEAPTLTNETIQTLLRYSWPGNVRELQNCIRRALAVASSSTIEPTDLPERIRDIGGSQRRRLAAEPSEMLPMAEVERMHIQRILDATAGNKSKAARILGFDRKTLYRKIEQYRITTRRGRRRRA